MEYSNNEELTYGYGPRQPNDMNWKNLLFLENLESYEMKSTAYDFLLDYSSVYNVFPACTAQPNPFSNRVMFIIDTLNKLNVKYTVDIFNYDGSKVIWGNHSYSSHKLVNIIVEPNPQVTGSATVFVAHHDVANVHSQNCQDNGASVCNLLRLISLIKKSKTESKRTIILFSDHEEGGAIGAKQFASKSMRIKNSSSIQHDIYGTISSVVNLELTGKGKIVWSDCSFNKNEEELHLLLETTLGQNIPKFKTPLNDAIMFRKYDYPVLCIGILPEDDLKDKTTWKICHSINDTIEKCDENDMEDFTNFLLNLTKFTTTEHGNDTEPNQTGGTLCT